MKFERNIGTKDLISDLKMSASIFKEARKARKEGGELVLTEKEREKSIPVSYVGSSFLDTVEGCTLYNCGREIYDIAHSLFKQLSDKEQKYLLAFPKESGMIERVYFWKNKLKPLLSHKQYAVAIQAIIKWYIHIKKMRQERAIALM